MIGAYTYRSEMCVCDVLHALDTGEAQLSFVVEEFSKNKYFQFFFEPLGTKYPFIEKFQKLRRIFFVISTAKNKKYRTLKEEEYE